MRGKFITFEGPEGSGKTTQSSRLVDRLRREGLDVVATREPGGTAVGDAIREILQHDRVAEPIEPETELMLFAASRAQLVRRVIQPAIERGAWVVCDRFADSTLAYQGYGRGLDVDPILALNDLALNGAVPDLTLLLDIDIDQGFDRLEGRNQRQGCGHDRIEREARGFHQRVREGYLKMAGRWPERFRIVEAGGPPESVEERIWAAIAPWTGGSRGGGSEKGTVS